MSEYTYTVIFEQDPETGRFTATIPALRCVTDGETLEEAREMAKDLIAIELEARREKGLPIPSDTPSPRLPTVERIAVGVP